jgi:hypothetical protein
MRIPDEKKAKERERKRVEMMRLKRTEGPN